MSSRVLGVLFEADPSGSMKISSADLLAFVASMGRRLEQSPVATQCMIEFILTVTGRSIGTLEAAEDQSGNVDLDAATVLLSIMMAHFSSVIWNDSASRQVCVSLSCPDTARV